MQPTSSADVASEKRHEWFADLGPVALTMTVFLLALASIHFGREVGRIAAIWPVNALLLVALLRSRGAAWMRYLAAGLVGGLAADLVIGDSLTTAVGLTACNLAEAGVCAALIRRFAGRNIDLGLQRHLIVFLLAAAVAPLVSGAGAALVLAGRHHATYFASVRGWYSADALGLFLVTPVLLAVTGESLRALGRTLRQPRGWLSPAALTATLLLVFSQNTAPLYFLIPAALTLMAFELNLAGVAIGLLITATAGVVMTIGGHGGLMAVRDGLTSRLEWFQIFIAIISVTILPVAAALATRRRLEANLREANRLSALTEQIAGIGYWRNDLVTGRRTWSEQVFAIHGLKPADVCSDQPYALNLYREGDGQKVVDAIRRTVTTGKPFDLKLTLTRADDGRERVVAYKGEGERDQTGAVCAVMGVIRDVTEEETARQAIEDAAAAKSLFLANMTHEIRTPLTSILGFANLLAGQPDLNETARTRVARVVSAGEALLSVVNDVLDFSKLEAGRFEILPKAVAPAELLRETLLMFSPQADAKGLSLTFEADSLPAFVLIDPDRLRQILINLVGNAIKFTDQGGVHLTAAYSARTGQLRVRVEDTGEGMTKAQQKKLFQRFSQVDASSTRRHGGTGLGLAISKGLAEAMGGTIGVASKAGVGSAFHFRIDAPVTQAPAAEAEEIAAGSALQGVRALIVDDNPMNRELARAVLAPFGVEISEAADGLAAVAAAAHPFDVILMDIRMPRMDGPAALAQIRSGDGPNRDAPILAFTADAQVAGIGEPRGFDGLVRKPIVAMALAQAISEAVCREAQPGVGRDEAAA
ncbi:ATP-binding protein [Phenylobacterium sp.]|uniref:ATP-binding protein n=1 Tax=Phenylobacterium sp. TaxID=1871053 RepID=UPI002B89DE8D|nr:ATP-binding protein [Phenylobacterium sp.]HLZ76409.1 ATP-binding protein [Phenylobacterium sp.]